MPITPKEYLEIARVRITQEIQHLNQLEKAVADNEKLLQEIERLKKEGNHAK